MSRMDYEAARAFARDAKARGLSKEQALAEWQQSQQGVGGQEAAQEIAQEAPRKTSFFEAWFPRTASRNPMEEGKGIIANPALDVMSAIGRQHSSTVGARKEAGLKPWQFNTPEVKEDIRRRMTDIEGEGFADRMVRDPALLPSVAVGGGALSFLRGLGGKLAGKLASSVGSGAAAGATSAGVHATEEEMADGDPSLGSAAAEIGLSAGLPIAGKGAIKGAETAHALVRMMSAKLSGATRGGVSSTEAARVLERYGLGRTQGAKEMEAVGDISKSLAEQGEALKKSVETFAQNLPEQKIVNDIIGRTGKVDLSPAIVALENAKRNLSIEGKTLPAAQAAGRRIDDMIQALRGTEKGKFPKTKLSAKGYLELRRALDQGLPEKDAVDFNLVERAVLDARSAMKDALEQAAGPEYASAMRSWSAKLDLADELGALLGKKGTQAQRTIKAARFMDKLFDDTPDARVWRGYIDALDKEKGTNFLKIASDIRDAKIFGGFGETSVIPETSQGQALLAALLGADVLGISGVRAVIPFTALSSTQRGAAGMLAGMQKGKAAAKNVLPFVAAPVSPATRSAFVPDQGDMNPSDVLPTRPPMRAPLNLGRQQ